jgi:hypothetical protein
MRKVKDGPSAWDPRPAASAGGRSARNAKPERTDIGLPRLSVPASPTVENTDFDRGTSKLRPASEASVLPWPYVERKQIPHFRMMVAPFGSDCQNWRRLSARRLAVLAGLVSGPERRNPTRVVSHDRSGRSRALPARPLGGARQSLVDSSEEQATHL